jgi:4a-hydroxytetrahydrobiopterin dehydratase
VIKVREELYKKKCKACTIGAEPLKREEILDYMESLDGDWRAVDDHHLERTFKFKNFKEALDYVNRLGELAEEEQHHPDICLSWGKVVVTLFTHKIGGLSESDIVFAAKVDRLDQI